MYIRCHCYIFWPHMGHHQTTHFIVGDHCTVHFFLSTLGILLLLLLLLLMLLLLLLLVLFVNLPPTKPLKQKRNIHEAPKNQKKRGHIYVLRKRRKKNNQDIKNT
jgi:hypothetical protein